MYLYILFIFLQITIIACGYSRFEPDSCIARDNLDAKCYFLNKQLRDSDRQLEWFSHMLSALTLDSLNTNNSESQMLRITEVSMHISAVIKNLEKEIGIIRNELRKQSTVRNFLDSLK